MVEGHIDIDTILYCCRHMIIFCLIMRVTGGLLYLRQHNILTLFDIHVHDIVIKSQDCCLMLCGLIIYFGFAKGMFISSFQMGE